MSIKKDHLIAIATLLKMDVAKFTAALDADTETEIELPTGIKVFTDTELTSREETLKKQHEKAGMEIQAKTFKTKMGLEIEGKDDEKIIEAYKTKVLDEANIEESAKVKELNTTIDGLRTNIQTLTTEKESSAKTAKQAQDDATLLSWTIDKKPENISNTMWLAMLKVDNEITEHEGAVVVKRNGKIVQNPTDLKDIPAKDAILSYIEENKIGKPAGAAGGGAGGGGRNGKDSQTTLLGITNMKQFNEHLTAQGISPNGDKAKQLLNEITAANTNFDFTPTAEAASAA